MSRTLTINRPITITEQRRPDGVLTCCVSWGMPGMQCEALGDHWGHLYCELGVQAGDSASGRIFTTGADGSGWTVPGDWCPWRKESGA